MQRRQGWREGGALHGSRLAGLRSCRAPPHPPASVVQEHKKTCTAPASGGS